MNIKHYLVLILVVIHLASCISHDESYYRLHPQALQTALKKCTTNGSEKGRCEQLAAIASRLNSLALDLQHNPQGFGKQILAFQETLAQQQEELRKDPNNFVLKQTIATTEQQLEEHLAVVKWLESPEG